MSGAAVRLVSLARARRVVSDWPSAEQCVADAELHRAVDQSLARLPTRDRRILCKRYGLGGYAEMTLAEIGADEGVSKGRIRQILLTGLRRLRHPSRARALRPFLECWEPIDDAPADPAPEVDPAPDAPIPIRRISRRHADALAQWLNALAASNG